MKRFLQVMSVVTAVAMCLAPAAPVAAEQIWSADTGTATFMLYHEPLEGRGVFIAGTDQVASPVDGFSNVTRSVEQADGLLFEVVDQGVTEVIGRYVTLADGFEVVTSDASSVVRELLLLPDAQHDANINDDTPCLELRDLKVGFDFKRNQLRFFSRHVTLSGTLARELGDPELAGVSVGTVLIILDASWIEGDEPSFADAYDIPIDPENPTDIGGDVTFCQLYGLRQYGRVGDIVGLAVATTSWNVGTEELDWYGSPNSRHPFIIMNMFRLKNDRIEQIGQSWIKHGFCALDSTQCGGSCTPTGCGTLNVNCTDTYSASLNAAQSGLGPRDEVDPWTGDWQFEGSHFAQGNQSHNGIQHRLQVHDADLDPAQNPGATYYIESLYVTWDDINVMNSAAWKPAAITSGVPGGTWQFGVTSSGVYPNIGFGIDAWQDAAKTTVAEEVPVVEFESPDGRCVLAAKANDLGLGQFHYEYALLNIDMDRKVDSFSVPLPQGVVISNVGFHAVESHDEPYSNDPWTVEITDEAITWSTVDNPIRWGTMYNFRFDANARPDTKRIALGLYEPGDPDTCLGETLVPAGPRLLKGEPETSFQAHSFGAYLDPRAESSNGVNLNLGLIEFSLVFSEPVENIGGGGLTETAFVIRQTGADPPPNVVAISTADNQEVSVVLDRIISLQEWTTIEASVQSMTGVQIETEGDLGPGAFEKDRIDVGFLPGDVDQSADVSPFDLLMFRQIVQNLVQHEIGEDEDYVDIDRNSMIEPADLLMFRQMINGVTPPATMAWAGQTMNNTQP